MYKVLYFLSVFILLPYAAYTGPVQLGFDAELGVFGIDGLENPFGICAAPSVGYRYKRWQYGANISIGIRFGSAGTEVNYFIKPKKERLRYLGLTVDHVFFTDFANGSYSSGDGFAIGIHSGHTKLLNKHHLFMSSCTGFKIGNVYARAEQSGHGSVGYAKWNSPLVYIYVNIGLRKRL